MSRHFRPLVVQFHKADRSQARYHTHYRLHSSRSLMSGNTYRGQAACRLRYGFFLHSSLSPCYWLNLPTISVSIPNPVNFLVVAQSSGKINLEYALVVFPILLVIICRVCVSRCFERLNIIVDIEFE